MHSPLFPQIKWHPTLHHIDKNVAQLNNNKSFKMPFLESIFLIHKTKKLTIILKRYTNIN